MTTPTPLAKSYAEPNPLDVDVEAAKKLIEATGLRQDLYHWLRELADERGVHDVRHRDAEEVARYTHRRVGSRSGFSPEECAHINGQLDKIMELTQAAYPTFRC